MKDYSKMSDFELNVQVAEKEFVNWYCSASNSPSGGWEYCSVDELMLKDDAPLKDYCNNPSDAWPIMKESLIGVTPYEDGVTMHFYGVWTARPHCKDLQFTDKNPLRAAMIVYLMMKDEDK